MGGLLCSSFESLRRSSFFIAQISVSSSLWAVWAGYGRAREFSFLPYRVLMSLLFPRVKMGDVLICGLSSRRLIDRNGHEGRKSSLRQFILRLSWPGLCLLLLGALLLGRSGLELQAFPRHWLCACWLVSRQAPGKCCMDLRCSLEQLVCRWNPLFPLSRYIVCRNCRHAWVRSFSLSGNGVHLQLRGPAHFVLERH